MILADTLWNARVQSVVGHFETSNDRQPCPCDFKTRLWIRTTSVLSLASTCKPSRPDAAIVTISGSVRASRLIVASAHSDAARYAEVVANSAYMEDGRSDSPKLAYTVPNDASIRIGRG